MPNRFEERARAAVVAVFFLSGASGLVYQILWVRQFAKIFGNTIHSAALVTGVFMGGLGAGSFLLGRWSDRRWRADPAHPLRVYGYAELAIAALGLLLTVALPRLSAVSAALFAYERGARGFHELSTAAYAARYAVAVVAVAPATFLMGGTLPLLIRFMVGRDVREAGRRVGLLYGLNTAGAALGALLTDFVFVPSLGISGTQLAAAALNVSAGALALALARRGATTIHEAPLERPATALDAASAGRHIAALAGVALLLAGFAAMGFEIVWFRYLTQILGELRGVFSLLLAVILVGIWLGAMGGGALHHRLGKPELLFMISQTLFTLSTFALLGLLDSSAIARAHANEVRQAFLAAPPARRGVMELWSNLRSIGAVVFVPAILMGASFPLANAAAQRAEESVAGRAGLLYLSNTAGNVLGSVLVGFVILPAVGIQKTALVLLGAAALSVAPLAAAAWRSSSAFERAERAPREVIAFAGCAAALVVAFAGSSMLPADHLLRPALPDDEGGAQRTVSVSEGLNETVVITEIPGYRTNLFTNGHSMSADGPRAQRYMHAFSHLPLLAMESPERVLVICFGTGNTLHAASLHPVRELEIADLSRHVLDHAPFFRATNHDVLEDPRVSVFVNDGRHHLLMQPPGAYDLITLEPPPIAFAGIAGLYSREFYALARDRLKPGGYLTQWLPGYQLGGDAVLAMVRAFIEVFPSSVLLSGDGNELILMGTTAASIALDEAALRRRLAERPRVAADLARLDMGTLTEIAGAFVASYETMAAATARTPALTDDRPSIEYVRLSRLGSLAADDMPRALFDPSKIDAFCPGCLSTVPRLAAYLRVQGLVYASVAFLSNGRTSTDLPSDRETLATVAGSAYLSRLFGGEAYGACRAGAAHLARGALEEAIACYTFALVVGGPDAEAFEGLGLATLESGDADRAARALSRALQLDANRPDAHKGLARASRQLGDATTAIVELERGLALTPEDVEAHYDLGILLNAAGRKDAAQGELETTLALDPLHPRANLVLCKRAAVAGDLESAAARCDVAAQGGVKVPEDLAAKLAGVLRKGR